MLLSKKLALAAAIISVTSIGIASFASLQISSSALRKKSVANIEAVADGRRNQLETYLANVELDVSSLAQGALATNALQALTMNWQVIPGDPSAELRRRYITENPNTEPERDKLDNPKIDSYDAAHGRFNAKFRAIAEGRGYGDLFLVDMKGNVVYSVKKREEFAANLTSDGWKSSALARIYTKAIDEQDAQQVYFEDYAPYQQLGGQEAAFIALPVFANRSMIGVLIAMMPDVNIAAIMDNKTGLGQTGRSLLLNSRGTVISAMAEPSSRFGKALLPSDLLQNGEGRAVISTVFDDAKRGRSDLALAAVDFKNAGWKVATIVDESEVMADIVTMRRLNLLIAIGLSLAMLPIAYFFSRSIARPIQNLVKAMQDLAAGNTAIELHGENRKDEIGAMVRSVAVFRDAAIRKIELEEQADVNRQRLDDERIARETIEAAAARAIQSSVKILGDGLRRLSDGDLTVVIDEPFGMELDELRKNFNTSVEKLNAALSEVDKTVRLITDGAEEMRGAADDLFGRTQTQAAALEEASAALSEITETVQSASDQAIAASEMVKSAEKSAKQSSRVVGEAIDAIGRLERASAEISTIINVIDEISFQTNLLALNAGVEASRAGEAGRGFAVVAQEVRELAQRAASSASEIKDLIGKSEHEVRCSVDLVRATGAALQEIGGHVTGINGRVSSIASTARKQSHALHEVSGSVQRIDRVTQQNAMMVEQTANVTRRFSTEVQSLIELLEQFHLNRPAEDAAQGWAVA
ncbi:methyl-accepting chemotaxis protein (plasmid) [Agrobacterium deltaense]|uniref:methyl-accepting chemotaxis protein n=1 Tax=Agrobacterium deltaense TaxID=1183412 RepID=UPI003D965694